MGRPREHDETTRQELLAAAEAIVEQDGVAAVSVRVVADAVGTTTRAVYSLFGSKAGMLAALAQQSFELLTARIAVLPETNDPAADLVEASVQVFRWMATEHPSSFALAFLGIDRELASSPGVRAEAVKAFRLLCDRFDRLKAAGGLPRHDSRDAATIFNALCEGMATTELRTRGRGESFEEERWRDAFTTLLAGFA